MVRCAGVDGEGGSSDAATPGVGRARGNYIFQGCLADQSMLPLQRALDNGSRDRKSLSVTGPGLFVTSFRVTATQSFDKDGRRDF